MPFTSRLLCACVRESMAHLPIQNYFKHGLVVVFFNIDLVNCSGSVDLEKNLKITEVFVQPDNFLNIKIKINNDDYTIVNSVEPGSFEGLFEIDLNTLQYLEVTLSSGDAQKIIVFKKLLSEFVELEPAELVEYNEQTYQSSFLKSQKYCYNYLSFYEEVTI